MFDPETLRWLMNNGLAVLIIFCGGWAAFVCVKWFGNQVLVPVRDAMIGHLKTVDGTLTEVSDALTTMKTTISNIDDKAEVIISHHDQFFAESRRDRVELRQRIVELEKNKADK